ncbi:hypothetical protein T484DRAFT_1756063 [Baffinella frigidus]|nr:hypothetical protein T484DRAFT_1756063 [Cryptophyta sp. CCMP2293]
MNIQAQYMIAYKMYVTALVDQAIANENLVSNIDGVVHVLPHPTGVQPLLHPVTGAGPVLQAITDTQPTSMVDLTGGEHSQPALQSSTGSQAQPTSMVDLTGDEHSHPVLQSSTGAQAQPTSMVDLTGDEHSYAIPGVEPADLPQYLYDMERVEAFKISQLVKEYMNLGMAREQATAAVIIDADGMCHVAMATGPVHAVDSVPSSNIAMALNNHFESMTMEDPMELQKSMEMDCVEALELQQEMDRELQQTVQFYIIEDFGPSWLMRKVVFYYYTLDPGMVKENIVPPSRLMHILCVDDKGNSRPASCRDDWGDQEPLIALLRVLPGLDIIILVTPCGYSRDNDRGYGVRFDIYTRPVGCITNELATTNKNVRKILGPLSRDVNAVHNVSVEDIKLAMARSNDLFPGGSREWEGANGFRVVGFIGGHYSYFTGLIQ